MGDQLSTSIEKQERAENQRARDTQTAYTSYRRTYRERTKLGCVDIDRDGYIGTRSCQIENEDDGIACMRDSVAE